MKMDLKMFDGIDRPMYVVEESRLRHNLHMINKVAERANVEIILAFKAFALWKTFPIFEQPLRVRCTRHASVSKSSELVRIHFHLHTQITRLTKLHIIQVI